MRLRIDKEFVDKITGERYKVGKVVEFDDERAKAILADPRELATEAKETKKPEADKPRAKKSK